MKKIIRILLGVFFGAAPFLFQNSILAQTSAFTYQGQLTDGGAPATGVFDLRFAIFDASAGGNAVGEPITNATTTVANGVFAVTMDFGAGVFTGGNRWLELGVRTNGSATAHVILEPRQLITAAPYAIQAISAGVATVAASANSVAAANVTGTLDAARIPDMDAAKIASGVIADERLAANVARLNANNVFTGNNQVAGVFTGDGRGLTGVPGTMAFQMVAGTAQAASPNAAYLLLNAGETAVTLPTSANVGDQVRVFGAGAGGWHVQAGAGQSLLGANRINPAGETWLNRDVSFVAGARGWRGVATSADGQKIFVVNGSGGLHVSSIDGGETWTARNPAKSWVCVASSADGTKLAAAGFFDVIYLSTDSGATWNPAPNTPSAIWYAMASSADGTRLLAAAAGGQLHVSTDSGATWTPREESRNWTAVASSSDGMRLVATASFPGVIRTSSDGGETWMVRESGSKIWQSVACSTDGSKIVVVADQDLIYTSDNFGATWTPRETNRSWFSVASSADGTKLIAAPRQPFSARIYASADSGETWTPRGPERGWTGLASSADGSRIIGLRVDGQIWTSAGSSYFAGASGTAATFQYVGDSNWRVVTEATTPEPPEVTNITGAQIQGGAIVNAHIAANAAIADSKLATIATAGKVDNSATTATSDNSPGTIVARDLAGNFSAGAISGAFVGNGAGLTNLNVANSATSATSDNAPGAIVARDSGGNFSAGVITGAFAGDGSRLTNLPIGGGGGGINWDLVTGFAPVAMVSNRGYIASNSLERVEFTLPAAPSVGDIVRVTGASARGFRIDASAGQIIRSGLPIGYDLGEGLYLAKTIAHNFTGVGCAWDGYRMIAVADGEPIFRTDDAGLTWTTNETARAWRAVAAPKGGNTWAAAVQNGQIYISSDSGVTWTPRATARNWSSIAMGEFAMAAVVDGGFIYVSQDQGVTWEEKPHFGEWQSVAANANGSIMVAVAKLSSNDPTARISRDSGATWTPLNVQGHFKSVAISDYGTIIIAHLVDPPDISYDFGETWSRGQRLAAAPVAISSLGNVIRAAGTFSTSGGFAWNGGEVSFTSCALSGNGKTTIGANGPNLYISGGARQKNRVEGWSNSSIELQYIGNGVFLVLNSIGLIQF